MQNKVDVVVVGGGIVGLATAKMLCERYAVKVTVLEAEDRVAAHQTGHNSGVIHSGLYYKPGSLKAGNCVRGREAMYRYCEEKSIPHERCGKIVVALSKEEVPALDELERRGRANGLAGLLRLTGEELRGHEPHVAGMDGLFVPQTGIVDYAHVAAAYVTDIQSAGGEVRTRSRVTAVRQREGMLVVESETGDLETRALINCAGLQSDRFARLCGVNPGLKIIPFRGEYYELKPERQHLVRNLIYPVPDPRFPFLGVHFTRMAGGGVEAGPNAVLAFRREGYAKTSFSPRDTAGMLGFSGFWIMIANHWKTGLGEMHRSLSKAAFVKALQRLMPEIQADDLTPGGAGVRAQAVLPDGKLVDDFRIVESPRVIHVLNAPSPAATASLSIGLDLAERAQRQFSLRPKS